MKTLRKQLEEFIEARDRDDTRLLREVAGAADFGAVLKNSITPPAVYIVRGQQRRTGNSHTKTVTEQMMINIAVTNVRDARGGDTSDDAQVWSERIEAWLKDFTAELGEGKQYDSHEFQGGRVQRWTDQVVIWSDIYLLTYHTKEC